MTATEYQEEQVILVDRDDQAIGLAEKLFAHQHNLLHRAFSVFVFREQPQKQLLLQQRAAGKYHCASLWTNTCCSHPRQGEEIIQAGERRLLEEMGINCQLKNIGKFHYNAYFANGLSENEIDHVLIGQIPADMVIAPNPQEVQNYRWITLDALQQELHTHPQIFTPWLKLALEQIV
jgi:isopentenyl-diphosphate Delta-isomerase